MRTDFILVAALVVVGSISMAQQTPTSQSSPPPLSVSDIEHGLKAGVTNTRMAALVKQYGVDFEVTDAVEKEIRAAGANGDLLLQVARNKRLNSTLDSGHAVESESKNAHPIPINNFGGAFKSIMEKCSYARGINEAKGYLASQGVPSIELNSTMLAQGWRDFLSNNDILKWNEIEKTFEEVKNHARPEISKSLQEKLSYTVGMQVGYGARALENNIPPIESNPGLEAEGINDTLANRNIRLTPEEAKAALAECFGDEYTKRSSEARNEASKRNKIDGAQFLAANKLKEGVVTLPSGLQYKVLKQGEGPKPIYTDKVFVTYQGKLIDGREFASIYRVGRPSEVQLNQATKGWVEALQLMPVGSKWELYIPPDLAFGEQGGGLEIQIGPNATLIEDVELLSIKPKDEKVQETVRPNPIVSSQAKPAHKEIKDPTEYTAYMAAIQQKDPSAQISGFESFLTRYPNSVMKEDALEFMLAAYQQTSNMNKMIETAIQLLTVDTCNERALPTLAYFYHLMGREDAKKYAQQGMDCLSGFNKPDNMSDSDFQKMKRQLIETFDAALGPTSGTASSSEARSQKSSATTGSATDAHDCVRQGVTPAPVGEHWPVVALQNVCSKGIAVSFCWLVEDLPNNGWGCWETRIDAGKSTSYNEMDEAKMSCVEGHYPGTVSPDPSCSHFKIVWNATYQDSGQQPQRPNVPRNPNQTAR